MTNREKIDKMNNEEMAQWLSNIINRCEECDRKIKKYCDDRVSSHFESCTYMIWDWLESEVEE